MGWLHDLQLRRQFQRRKIADRKGAVFYTKYFSRAESEREFGLDLNYKPRLHLGQQTFIFDDGVWVEKESSSHVRDNQQLPFDIVLSKDADHLLKNAYYGRSAAGGGGGGSVRHGDRVGGAELMFPPITRSSASLALQHRHEQHHHTTTTTTRQRHASYGGSMQQPQRERDYDRPPPRQQQQQRENCPIPDCRPQLAQQQQYFQQQYQQLAQQNKQLQQQLYTMQQQRESIQYQTQQQYAQQINDHRQLIQHLQKQLELKKQECRLLQVKVDKLLDMLAEATAEVRLQQREVDELKRLRRLVKKLVTSRRNSSMLNTGTAATTAAPSTFDDVAGGVGADGTLSTTTTIGPDADIVEDTQYETIKRVAGPGSLVVSKAAMSTSSTAPVLGGAGGGGGSLLGAGGSNSLTANTTSAARTVTTAYTRAQQSTSRRYVEQ